MTPEEVLKEAADLLRQRGWVPHASAAPGRPMCMVEAVTEVVIRVTRGHNDSDWAETYHASIDLLRKRVGPLPVVWNDSQTSIEPVLAMLEGR